MRTATTIIGALSASIWSLLLLAMLVLIAKSPDPVDVITIAFAAVPLAMFGLALWLVFYGARRPTKFLLAVEVLLVGAGVFCWLIFLAASGA